MSFPDPPPKRKGGSGDYSTSSHYGLAVTFPLAVLKGGLGIRLIAIKLKCNCKVFSSTGDKGGKERSRKSSGESKAVDETSWHQNTCSRRRVIRFESNQHSFPKTSSTVYRLTAANGSLGSSRRVYSLLTRFLQARHH